MMRGWAPLRLLLVLTLGGCAYYNGIYNAKSAAKKADRLLERGESYAAGQAFLESAAKAETVLARHPRTRWRSDALYYSARGFALAGENCPRGMRRLDEYFARPSQSTARDERALIARASCMLGGSDLLIADSILTTLLDSRDAEVRGQAALWAGRVALLLGDAARAEQMLARVPGTGASWEFMLTAFQRGNIVRAESLLMARAEAGDWRSEVHRHVRALWIANQRAAAIRIVDLYGDSRAPTSERVLLRFLASDLAASVGDTALARRQANEAQRLGLSPAVDAEAQVRLLALRIRELDVLADVEAAVKRDSVRARGTPLLRRIADNLTIIHILLDNPDVAGGHMFLAAEIARDSLSAYKLAHSMFRSIERDNGDFELAARALLASRTMFPESTQVYEARIMKTWPRSFSAGVLQGIVPDSTTVRAEDAALRRAWTIASGRWADTLKARRAADSLAALNGVRKQ